MKHSLTQRTSYSVVTSNSILLIKQVGLKLSFKSISEEDLRIGSGREFHPAGPATSNILFPNCNFALFGAVHKVRHAIFGQFWPPPPVTLWHTSRDPPKVRHTSRTPRFLVGLVQKTRTKAPCTNSLLIVRG